MGLFIAGEASLFSLLFFSYYYLGAASPVWPPAPAPPMKLALAMTVVLLASGGVLHWGTRALRAGRAGRARGAVVGTLVLGAGFLGIQAMEYRDHWRTLTPQSGAYGSIFYTITTFHAAHLLGGWLLLLFVLLLPWLDHGPRAPHRPLHNAALYWHFVDLVWLVVVAVLYVSPRLGR
jgi:heme/copper-type cytochrome/quinol oxidase subunit 3